MNAFLLETINQTCEASVYYGAAAGQETISTGLPALDAAMGGGIPRGRIVELHGAPESGKTALALHLARQTGGPVLYADADGGLSPYILGGQTLYLLKVKTLEDALGACWQAAAGFGAIVIDTVTAFPTEEDLRLSINEKNCQMSNQQARILSRYLPILSGRLYATGCTLILVNQMRERPGILFGRKDRPTGGRAIGYYAALRLETIRREVIRRSEQAIGQISSVDVTKCKYAPPGCRAAVKLIYGEGVSV